jgi:hypothetical protein
VDQITERKVVRRGMIAALASLGAAAMLKVSGAGKASAADGDALMLGNTANVATPTGQDFTSRTRINFTTVSSTIPAVDVRHGPLAIGQAISGGHAIYAGNNNANSAIFGRNHFNGAGVGGVSQNGPGISGAAGLQGVRGIGTSNGVGVIGASNSGIAGTPDGTGSGIGVHGKSTGGPGVQGESVNGLGVRGLSTNFVAMVGISQGDHGLYGSTANFNAIGLVGENLGGGLAGYFAGNVQITGALQVFGAKNAVIRMQDGTNASVYCQESPEPYFEDFGRAQLAGGVANVALEREFAGLVGGGDYMVFPVAEGETRGLFVSRRGPGSFEVREMQGGTGNVPFTYRVVTKRKDIDGRRFARVSDAAAKSVAASRAALGVTGAPPANPTPGPFVPNPPAPNPNVPSPNVPGPTAPNAPTGGPSQPNPPSIAGPIP